MADVADDVAGLMDDVADVVDVTDDVAGLMGLPKMPETTGKHAKSRITFTPSAVDPDSVKFKDKCVPEGVRRGSGR
eukprot:329465-Pyramimonas_sp.AAC.1